MTGFSDETASRAWDRGAEAWQAFVRSGADYYRLHVHGPGLLDAVGDVRGRRVLDAGCGEGYFSRELARRGASVVGIDITPALVAAARAEEQREPLGIRYEQISAVSMSGLADASFDAVTSCMAVQDMSDPLGCLTSAHRVLKRGGRMVFSVPHPCTDTPHREWQRDAHGAKLALSIDRYFDTGAAECDWSVPRLAYRWKTPCWRRTLSEWSSMLVEAGFLIRRLHEPKPTAEQVTRHPSLDDCSRLPYFLIFDVAKSEM